MSKPALGRGLGSLLNGRSTPVPESGPVANPPAGVKLLLRGGEEEEDCPNPSAAAAPWLVPLLFGADAVLVVAGALLFFWGHPVARIAAGAMLVLVGGSLAFAAVLLGSRPPKAAPSRPTSARPGAGASETPAKLRVHFVDEMPRQRKN